MSNLMKEAYDRRRALEEDDAPEPRRPGRIGGSPRLSKGALGAAVVGAIFALLIAVSAFWGAEPAGPAAAPAAWPTPLPGATVPSEPWYAPTAEPAAEPVAPPTAAPAPAEAPPAAPEQPAPPQAAPMAPAPVYTPPAPTVDIFANPSELTALPNDTGLGEREKPCTHPSCEGSQP